MTLTTAQWIMLVTMLAASIVVVWVLRRILGSLLKRSIRKVTREEPNAGLVRSVSRSLAFMLVSEGDALLLPLIQLPSVVTDRVATLLDALALAFLTIAVYRFVDLVCARAVLHMLRTRTDGHEIAETLAPLVASTIKVLVVVIGGMWVLGYLGVNVAAIITGLSIGGAALALASQDTVKNLFGSLVIITDRPFVVGDWISTPGAEGVVKEIGFRSTRIVTSTGSLITLSNGKLADAVIDNVGVKRKHPMSTSITVDAATPLDAVEKFVEVVRASLSTNADVMADAPMSAAIREVSPVGITIAITFHIRAARQNESAGILHRIHLEMLRSAQQLSITLATSAA